MVLGLAAALWVTSTLYRCGRMGLMPAPEQGLLPPSQMLPKPSLWSGPGAVSPAGGQSPEEAEESPKACRERGLMAGSGSQAGFQFPDALPPVCPTRTSRFAKCS